MSVSPQVLRQVRMTAVSTDRNPNMDGGESMDHWRCYLRSSGRRMNLVFSKGVGHEGKPPTVSEVLECLASDASSIESARGFEDWCGYYGYDTDSRKAERTYSACVRQAASLKRVLGPELYEELLFGEPPAPSSDDGS